MKQLRNALTHLLNGLAGLSFLAMVVLTCWQVVTRYLLQNPSSWSEELVSYLFAWMALLGASLVTSERGHMNILAMGQMTSSLGVAIGVFYIVLPLCGVLNMVYTAMNIYDIVKGNIPVLPTSEEDSLVDNLKKEEA